MESISKFKTVRIENHKIDKAKRTFLLLGIGMIIISVIKFLTATSSQITGFGWGFDTLLLVVIPIYFLLKFQKQLTKRSRQFIEWTADAIIFKLKHDSSSQKILREQIDSIIIHLHTIEIIDRKNQKYLLDISDFDKYEDRLKIKEHFENEKINA